MKKAQIKQVISILLDLKQAHHYECEDGFYSCPKHPDYFGYDDREHCSCGMDYTNEQIDKAIALLEGRLST